MGNPTWTRRAVLSAALGSAAAGLLAPGTASADRIVRPGAGGPTRSILPVAERPARRTISGGRRRVAFGAYVPDPYWDFAGWPADLAAFTRRAGQAPSIVHWFSAWGGEQDFPAQTAAYVASSGAIPLLTWEPWDWSGGGAAQPDYRLSRITAGAFDPYVRRFAQQAKAFGKPVYLRFAPEMNGDWNPWSEQVNGNRPGDFVKAWKHVRSVFASVGATNVRWVWTPIVEYGGSTPLKGLYPGDASVDVVGLDGYNWGSTKPNIGWKSFSQVFGPSLTAVRSLSRKPLWIAEIGCTEQGGSKAAWVDDMFATVAADSRVDALVWFDADKETDWRINSSSSSLAAFARGLTSPLYG